ncbi:RteC domain-containing protein [Flavicella marina]|uniref:RteC domain-containing protein n=1 Tax=Flavicella marina TaxID=1475951 RepID=UPI0012659119|nr:RteC domain-containing protein [Flavicella marina]
MKKILPLIDSYAVRKKNLASKNLNRQKHLKEKITLTKEFIHELRLHVRKNNFNNVEDEIYFFKYVKPKICSELLFYTCQLSFYTEKPNATICIQKDYMKSSLKKLESRKRKNLKFYKYYKNGEDIFDDKYFLRGNGQFHLFASPDVLYSDPEFNTSHDVLASEVIVYDLLTEFYKNELKQLKNKNIICPDKTTIKNQAFPKIRWTASKTDLIELVYSLKLSGSIDDGNGHLKNIMESMASLFDVELGNYYKTYSEIKNRNKHKTRFLHSLTEVLSSKLEEDDRY